MIAALALQFAALACNDSTSPEARTPPPTVTGSLPASGATGVEPSSTITVTFSEAMDAATINAATLRVETGATSIAGTVSYDGASRTADFTPSAPLNPSTTYGVTVTTGVKGLAGNALATNFSFTFTTRAPPETDLSTNVSNDWWQTTTVGGVDIHFHVLFAQSGGTLSPSPRCPHGLNDGCITLARNEQGATAIGPSSPGYVWVLLTGVTGTISGSQVTFTMTNANGRTFTFSGRVNNRLSMSGTISGPTLPSTSVEFSRTIQ